MKAFFCHDANHPSGISLLIAALSFFTGCAVVVAPADTEQNNTLYGPALTAHEFEHAVRTDSDFIGQGSGDVACSDPEPGEAVVNKVQRYGWISQCSFTLENKVGGYSRDDPKLILWSEGALFWLGDNIR